jgi:drug/metabolite transporter (DMT)-like permease
MRHMPGWQVVSWCVILYLPFSLIAAVTSFSLTHSHHTVSLKSVLALMFISFGSMYLGFFAWYRGLGDLGVARGSQIQLVQPLLTILWSVLLVGEHVSATTVATAGVVLTCVAATQRGRRLTR